jgi:hypothetical protein
MGSSEVGKTAPLDVLVQRNPDGTIQGDIVVGGRPLPVSLSSVQLVIVSNST